VSTIDRARWRAWGGVADIMGLEVTFRPIRGGWSASAKGVRVEAETGVDALAMLCQRVALRRR